MKYFTKILGENIAQVSLIKVLFFSRNTFIQDSKLKKSQSPDTKIP